MRLQAVTGSLPTGDRATLARGGQIVVVLALAVAVVPRMSPLVADFPIGEGGLFWVMANELREASFIPPDFTSYNGGDIPWMYPPLGLYLAAILGGGLEWFRILPAVFAVATLPAFWLLARSLVGSRAAMFALVAYGLASASYIGLTAGGGVARAPGVVLALLTLWAVVERRPLAAGGLAGLTILTHPLAAAYAAVGAVILWATRGAPRSMLPAPVLALLIGATWFVPMVARHGIEPLLSGLTSRGGLEPIGSLVLLARLVLYPPNMAAIIGMVGLVLASRDRRWDLLGLLAVSALGVGQSGRWTIIPLAVLAGYALNIAFAHFPSRAGAALGGVAVATAVAGVVWAQAEHTLTPEERATMEWVRQETSPATTVAVIGHPADGAVVEWFPALSERTNATTAQGSEWSVDGDLWDEAWAGVRCRDPGCLPEADLWVLPPGCCPDITATLDPVGPTVFAEKQ